MTVGLLPDIVVILTTLNVKNGKQNAMIALKKTSIRHHIFLDRSKENYILKKHLFTSVRKMLVVSVS